MRAGPKPEPRSSTLPRLRARTPSARFAEFCRRFLRHQQGPLAGKPVILAEWQLERIVRPLLDTVDEHGHRRYRQALVTMARRNGKTVLCAALALYELFYGEVGGEIIGAAGDRQQAHLAFDTARKMVEASDDLSAVTLVYRRQLVVPCRGEASYRVVSSDAGRQHGINVSFALVDELHAHRDRRLYDALATGTGSRAQPLVIAISTATEDPHSIMGEVYDYAVKVRDGVIQDDAFLPVIFTVPNDADPFDETAWPLANPALGTFRSLAEFRVAARQAREIPGRMASFRALYLNQMFVGSEAWLPLDLWDACQRPASLPPDSTITRAWIGVDLSSTTDLSAIAIITPLEDDGYRVRVEYFMPADNLERRASRDGVPYAEWVRAGWITATEGNVVDYQYIAQRLHELMAEYDVQAISCDPWNARQLIVELQQAGLPIHELQQSLRNLSAPTKEVERLVLAGRLEHEGNPVLRWNVTSARVEVDAHGNVRLSKRKSTARIDGLAAIVTGLSRALADTGPSVYDSREPLVVDL